MQQAYNMHFVEYIRRSKVTIRIYDKRSVLARIQGWRISREDNKALYFKSFINSHKTHSVFYVLSYCTTTFRFMSKVNNCNILSIAGI